MAEIVRALVPTADGDRAVNVGRAHAERKGYKVLDEATVTRSGNPRRETRENGRPAKKKTSVAKEAAAKKEAASSADDTDNSTASEEN